MNSSQDPSLSDVADAPARRTITAHFHVNLALIVAIIALLLTALVWLSQRREMDKLELEVSKRLASSQTLADEIRRNAEHNTERIQDASNRVAILENRLAEAQSQQEALNSMYQALAHNREDWLIAEAEQTLMLAHQQLQLAANIPAALTALQSLDQRLNEIQGPKIIRLHGALSKNIAALKALPYVDPAQLAGRLDVLLQKVDTLPLQIDHIRSQPVAANTAPAEKLSPAQKIGKEVWKSISQLIVVRRIDQHDAAVLGPENSFFVRENLKLRLGDARLTLLQRNTSLFQSDIRAAHDAITRYFDPQDKEVRAALNELKQLQNIKLQSEVVDLNDSIALARDLLRDAGTSPAPAAQGAKP